MELLVHTAEAMQAHAEAARMAGRRLALVPTMGALHRGHLALVEAARREADHVTVSVFVNPTQFGPGEDFERYPRTLAADVAALEGVGGVDAVFAPTVEAMYPEGLPPWASVRVRELDRHLDGPHRPGHFEGVCSVVTRLYNCCRPHVAVFGEKDAQQLAILRRMTRDLRFGIEVVGVATVREADGLALSSRNVYLAPEERRQAVALRRALDAAEALAAAGERRPQALVDAMRAEISRAPLARLQYAELVDAATLQPAADPQAPLPAGRHLAALAVYFGETRLIDNATLVIG